MTENTEKLSLEQRISNRLSSFFRNQEYSEEDVGEKLNSGEVFYKPNEVLPYVQTALLDETFVEVELNGIPQVYFTRLHDHPPEPDENDEKAASLLKNYKRGDYLKDFTHLISLPLEPGMGNFAIRNCTSIVLRYFTRTYAIELGTTFQELTTVGDTPVLRLAYPAIGRLNTSERQYRAKVPDSLDLKLMIIGRRRQKSITTRFANISVGGFAFYLTKKQLNLFELNEQRPVEIIINDVMEMRISGTIRHISKIRGKNGTEYLCGYQADLPTRAAAARLEEIVALVQRAHLRELSELARESGTELIK